MIRQCSTLAIVLAISLAFSSTNADIPDIKKNVYFNNVASAMGLISAQVSINNTVIFGSADGMLYSYDPQAGKLKEVTGFYVNELSGGTAYNGTAYLGSNDKNLYQYDPKTFVLKKIAKADDSVAGVAAINDKIYYGSYAGSLYELDLPTGVNKKVSSLGDNVTRKPLNGVAALNNKVYLGGGDNNLHEYNPATGERRVVANSKEWILPVMALNDKIYFGSMDDNLYEYNPTTEQSSSVCKLNGDGNAIATMNNRVYVGSNGMSVYEYNPATSKCVILANTTQGINTLTALNNRLYIGTQFLFEYYEETDLGGLIFVNNLREIPDKSNDVILRLLGARNPDLDISMLEVVNKTDTSATVQGKANNSRYFGQKEIIYALRSNNKANQYLDILEVLKDGALITYIAKNKGSKPLGVIDIATDYLQMSKVTATKGKLSDWDVSKSKKICYGTIVLVNHFNETQNMQTPECKYSEEINISTKVTKGLNLADKIEQTSNWIEELGAWPFADVNSNICQGGFTGNTGSSIDLGQTWGITNSTNLCGGTVDEFALPSQTVAVPPNTKMQVTVSLGVSSQKVTLNLKQNIKGQVVVKLLNELNNEVVFVTTVKEIMNNLVELNIYPQDLTVNDDDSVTFNGKLVRTLEYSSNANIEYSEQPTKLY